MKFNWVRHFSRVFVILICCCGAIAFGSAATAGLVSWVQLSPASSPPARSYLAMTYDPDSGKIIMFGGFDGTSYLNDTWTFDGVTWTHSHDTALASAPSCRPDGVRQCHSQSSALRRIQWNKLQGRHVVVGWDNFSVDTCQNCASSQARNWSDAVSGPKWQGRSFWRI